MNAQTKKLNASTLKVNGFQEEDYNMFVHNQTGMWLSMPDEQHGQDDYRLFYGTDPGDCFELGSSGGFDSILGKFFSLETEMYRTGEVHVQHIAFFEQTAMRIAEAVRERDDYEVSARMGRYEAYCRLYDLDPKTYPQMQIVYVMDAMHKGEPFLTIEQHRRYVEAVYNAEYNDAASGDDLAVLRDLMHKHCDRYRLPLRPTNVLLEMIGEHEGPLADKLIEVLMRAKDHAVANGAHVQVNSVDWDDITAWTMLAAIEQEETSGGW